VPRAEGDRVLNHLAKLRGELATTQRDSGDAQRLLELRIRRLEEAAFRKNADQSLEEEKLDTQAEQLRTQIDELEKRKVFIETQEAAKPPKPLGRIAQVAQIERLYKAKSFSQVVTNCNAFLEQYLNDKQFTAQMLYWRGDAYFKLSEYKKAVLSFQELLTKYPKFSKTPEMLYKVGLSLESLGFSKDSVIFYEEIINKHEKSPFSVKAKEQLKNR